MPVIVYYSSVCEKCIKLFNAIGSKKLENTMFFSVDTREVVGNQTYLILSNGARVLLPINVTQVPSLLIIDEATKKNTLKTGNEIYSFFNLTKNNTSTQQQDFSDPMAFQLNYKPIASDTFSFLESSSDDLLAEGNGGLQQLHHYSTLDSIHNIQTPPDNYTANTISNDAQSIDEIKRERDTQINQLLS